jgi:hypothetical protein
MQVVLIDNNNEYATYNVHFNYGWEKVLFRKKEGRWYKASGEKIEGMQKHCIERSICQQSQNEKNSAEKC